MYQGLIWMKNVGSYGVDFWGNGRLCHFTFEYLFVGMASEFQLNVRMMILESFPSTQNVVLAQTSLNEGGRVV